MSKSNREERAERAAAALREMQRKEKRRNQLTVAGVAAIIVLIVVGGFVVNQLRGKDEAVTAPSSTGGSDTYGVVVGTAGAPHSVVVYEDFLCPFCGMFETASHAQLAKLADEGKVRLDYRPFNLLGTDYSVAAASAFKVVLDASGATVAKKFHDELYDPDNQPSESGPFPSADDLVDMAVSAGATEADVKQGIEDESQKSWVEAATKAAQAAHVQSTPTILLDGKEFVDGASSAEIAANLITAVS